MKAFPGTMELSKLKSPWMVGMPSARAHAGRVIYTAWGKYFCSEVENFLRSNVSIISGIDVDSVFNHDIKGNYAPPTSAAISRSGDEFRKWMFIAGRSVKFFDDTIQTWLNSQTQWARYVSTQIKNYAKMTDEQFYSVRFLALKMLYPEAARVDDPTRKITGRIGNKLVAVSGHTCNLLLFAHVGVLDIRRYWRTVISNVKASSGFKYPDALKWYLNHDLLAEDNLRNQIKMLWHSHIENHVGIATYIILCSLIGERPIMLNVNYSISINNAILSKYPRYGGISEDVAGYLRFKK